MIFPVLLSMCYLTSVTVKVTVYGKNFDRGNIDEFDEFEMIQLVKFFLSLICQNHHQNLCYMVYASHSY